MKQRACGDSQCKTSSGIDDGLTFGSGRLDDWGYWSRPCFVCARYHDGRRKQERATIARRMRFEGHGKRHIRRYIARAAWLWLEAWPYRSMETPPIAS